MCKLFVKIYISIFLILIIYTNKANTLSLWNAKNDVIIPHKGDHSENHSENRTHRTKTETPTPTTNSHTHTFKIDFETIGDFSRKSKTKTNVTKTKEESKPSNTIIEDPSLSVPIGNNSNTPSNANVDTNMEASIEQSDNKPKDNDNMGSNISNAIDKTSNKSEDSMSPPQLNKYFFMIAVVGAVSIGLVAVSSYKVLKRKKEITLLKAQYCASTTSTLTQTTGTHITVDDINNPRLSLVNSLVYDNESQNEDYYYTINNDLKNPYSVDDINDKEQTAQNSNSMVQNLPYQVYLPNDDPRDDSDTKSIISFSRNSIIRHSFLNPNLHIVRTGKRTQQLYEATNDHPAIIETFPSLERPFVPSVPVPLEESDINSLHPHSIYQMYQEDMEFENYYAYTIDDKEYIIDPTTNRVLEIHDLNTDEYILVEEELYLDFSGSSSEDSDSEKQSL